MKAEQFYEVLGNYLSGNPELKEREIEIEITEPTCGPTPSVLTASLRLGFDWDNGRLLLSSDERLWREQYVSDLLEKSKQTYEIVKCTNHDMKDQTSYDHRIGRIVSEPVIDKRYGYALLSYLYDKDGSKMPVGQVLKTSPVSQIIRSFEDGKETMAIITENSYIYLEETIFGNLE